MKCEICGGNDVDGRHVLVTERCVRDLADRVAKLEATVDVLSKLARFIPPPGTASAIPDGFALAPGWKISKPGEFTCTHSDNGLRWDCKNAAIYDDNHAACAIHAVEMGALVPLVPAEPSGTPGEDAPRCKPGCGEPNGCRHRGPGGPPTGLKWSPCHKTEDSATCACTPACAAAGRALNPAPAPQPEAPAGRAWPPGLFDGLDDPLPAEPPRFVSGPQPEQRWRAPSEPAEAPLSRVIEALRTVEGPDYAEGFAAGVAKSNAKVADMEARLARSEKDRWEFEKAMARAFDKLADAEKDRAFMEAHAKEGWDLANKRTVQWKAAEKAADARVAEERARCLAWTKHVFDHGDNRSTWEAIASGTPAPRVKP